MQNDKKIKISIILIILAIITIDQIAKIIIINNDSYTIGTISLKYEEIAEKDSAMISILTDIVVFIIIIKFLKEQDKNMDNKVRTSLAFILGGGISNLIDKIWNKDVIGFIKIGKLPAINIAYIMLIIGWIAFITLMVKNTIKTNEEIKNINQQKAEIGRDKK